MRFVNYIKFVISRITDNRSNWRSHFRFFKLKLLSNNISLIDEIIFDKNTSIYASGIGKITVGEYLRIKDGSTVSAISGRLIIGNCVFINRNCNIICREHIRIDDAVSIGPNVIIWDHDHRFDEKQVYGMEYKTGEIIIEKGCWIGAGAIILRNTRIGEGSVIGAGTIVKGNIPPHSLVTMNRDLVIKPIRSKERTQTGDE